ncbi:hypothetical protein NAL32_19240 [Chryseobacterium sp. Ch-15]|uniref:LysM domain-containing protein n=1 Tax=Chryseobacterium muglaense TaxID=2893752 RepID=A0A9Q3YV36_9FLAO|nr:hypothetical protein [Chryseobacterium muglaense]MBD3906786.1 hypothetical protein [Chryseobacterium muglaense]MCC9034300.1 hypothetical protein [Chryseobacterium muglaense]MCM2556529.1 hypothetical protein [Chryseobacterium muglaense]
MMIHFILPGDTLENIAEKIRLENPVYLKEFHNQHCLKEDFIVDDLIPGKKLVLPDLAKIKAYNDKNDAPFKSPKLNPKIGFNPINFNEKFKVTIKESSNAEDKINENSFSYIASLEWKKNELGEHLFHFTKDQFSNQNETKMESLAIESMKSLYPIEVFVNTKGEILQTALKKEILNNFKQIKEKLLDFFPDKYAKIYLEEFEYVVLNANVFDQKMKEDWFLKNYFSSFRNVFENGNSFFEIYLNQTLLNIQQTVKLTDNKEEILLHQTLENKEENQNAFTGNVAVSKSSGMIKSMNLSHTYKEFLVSYTTEFSIENI